jgi:membrane protein CcdC involved in cytochrome C biogenesis
MEEKLNNTDQVQRLKNIREEFRAKAFRLVLEIAFIFGIPAALAFFIGGSLDERYETGKTIRLSLLAFTFVFSWVIVIFKYKRISRELHKIDEEIKEVMRSPRGK